jgi:AcrR family transcriptional regulator
VEFGTCAPYYGASVSSTSKTRSPQPRKRTGRRPGGQSSRGAVLDAARARFARSGYDATTIRAVAADAGVDPSLVMQFYGSKDGLFHAVLEQQSGLPDKVHASLAGPRRGAGERFTRAYLQTWEDPVTGEALRCLIRAAVGSEHASSLLRSYGTGSLSRSGIPVEKRLGYMLATMNLLGIAVGRYVVGMPILVAVPLEELVRQLSPAIDNYLTMTE